jgi:hypothetical protein
MLSLVVAIVSTVRTAWVREMGNWDPDASECKLGTQKPI